MVPLQTRPIITCVSKLIQHSSYLSSLNNKNLYFISNCRLSSIRNMNESQKLCKLSVSFKIFQRTVTHKSPLLKSIEKSDGDSNELISNDEQFQNFSKQFFHAGIGHNVLLIQPRVKYGRNWETKSKSELKLEEAVALVKTLPNWKVLEQVIVPVPDLNSKLIFGSGNLEKLKMALQKNPRITAVFVGIDILKALQGASLEREFRVQVFDRYQVILQIFHEHAHTKEAKLQLALAEVPYLRVKLCSFLHTNDASTFQGINYVGGSGETFTQTRRRILNEREIKLKKDLEKIKSQREFLRQSDTRSSYPIVAIVGYTNCGKTTLIKSLTNDTRLQPRDKLFATLDVTMHEGFLPSKQKVLYIDTVGFISDVPTALIQSFRSTLEEIHMADLVVHIRDISHPDTEAQKVTVLNTLKELDLPPKLLESVVEVNNKIDLLEEPITSSSDSDTLYISATEGTGLSDFVEIVEQKLFDNTGHGVSLLRIPNGGPEYSWLLRETALRDAIADPKDANYLIVEVILTAPTLAKFQHKFGDLSVSIESLSQ